MSIRQDIQKLDPGARIELFELDATALGGSVNYFHAGTNGVQEAIVWQGNEYLPWPINATGFEYNGRGQLPTPRMQVANLGNLMSALNIAYDDLVGATVTRRRTFARYLDGMPDEDPTAGLPDDVFLVDRKLGEGRVLVTYELGSSLDVQGVMIPLRSMNANACSSEYRGTECGYTGGAVADLNDDPTADLALDRCSKRLTGCRLRWGAYAELPYGGFPGLRRY